MPLDDLLSVSSRKTGLYETNRLLGIRKASFCGNKILPSFKVCDVSRDDHANTMFTRSSEDALKVVFFGIGGLCNFRVMPVKNDIGAIGELLVRQRLKNAFHCRLTDCLYFEGVDVEKATRQKL